jgi:hypothetical protein
MRIAHWSLTNGSGLHRVAESAVESEKKLGLDSVLANPNDSSEADWEATYDADVHVVHAHFPEVVKRRITKKLRIAWVSHGTPDHVFQSSVEAGTMGGYGHMDAVQNMQHWLKTADARITFWPRHQWILQQMVDKGTKVHLAPLGVDREFWAGGVTRGKYAGAPSVLSAENAHYIKWPYDLGTIWPTIASELDEATLHLLYLPRDMHRWFFPWFNAIGTSWRAHISSMTQDHATLRDTLKSVDFYCGLVRYGDFNHMSMQVSAAGGAKLISYRGNPYADFWITEGDQREMAKELIAILKGEVTPREKTAVPDLADTAAAFKAIYEEIAP